MSNLNQAEVLERKVKPDITLEMCLEEEQISTGYEDGLERESYL